MKKFSIVAFLAALLSVSAAEAQTNPNLITGQVLTAAQWNALFAAKQDTLGYTPLNTAGGVLTGELVTAPSSSTQSGLNIPAGAAPGTPANGDLWGTTAGLFYRANGVTIPLTGAGSGSFTASNPLAVTFPSVGVVNYALNINTSLALDGSNNLGINLTHANNWTAAQQFNLNSGAPVAPGFSSPIQMVGADATISALTFDTYGAAGIIAMRTAGGTRASKTAVASGSQISNLQGNGWSGSSYLGVSAIVQFAAENWTTSTSGTFSSFFTSPTGAGSPAQAETMRLTAGGGMALGNAVIATDPGAGSLIQSGYHLAKGTSSPTTAAGNSVITGTLSTAPTLSGNGQSIVFNTAVGGASLSGAGSTSDVSVLNKSGTIVATVPTGTTTLNLPSLSAVGTCSGSLVLDTSKNVTTGACPGAAGSIQVGTTTVTSGTTLNVLYNNAGVLANATITGPLQLSAGALSINGSLTAHGLLIGQGTGAITNTGAGTLGQFASSNGASADPSFVSGPETLFPVTTGSGVAALVDTTHITSAYNEYEVSFQNLTCATANTAMIAHFYVGGVQKVLNYLTSSAPFVAGVSGTGSAITTGFTLSSNTSNSSLGLYGWFRFGFPSSASLPKAAVWQTFGETTTPASIVTSGAGAYTVATDVVNGVDVACATGNISGTLRIRGWL